MSGELSRIFWSSRYPDSWSGLVQLLVWLSSGLCKDQQRHQKYELYLDKFSNVDQKMTNDVQLELQNLGKSPDELLEEIRAKADTTQRPS